MPGDSIVEGSGDTELVACGAGHEAANEQRRHWREFVEAVERVTALGAVEPAES